MSTPVNGFPIGPHRVLHRSPQGHQEVKEQVKGIKVNNRGRLDPPPRMLMERLRILTPYQVSFGGQMHGSTRQNPPYMQKTTNKRLTANSGAIEQSERTKAAASMSRRTKHHRGVGHVASCPAETDSNWTICPIWGGFRDCESTGKALA